MNKETYVDLPAIIVGTALTLAISIVLLHFGSSLGLAFLPDAKWDPDTAFGRVITISLWVLWVQLISSIVGGYVTGRIRAPIANTPVHEREMRDGIHGLSVWALGTVLVTIGAAIVAALTAMVPHEVIEQSADLQALSQKATVIVGFTMAAVSLVAAVASWWAGTKGGEHRDEAVDHSRYVSFRKL